MKIGSDWEMPSFGCGDTSAQRVKVGGKLVGSWRENRSARPQGYYATKHIEFTKYHKIIKILKKILTSSGLTHSCIG